MIKYIFLKVKVTSFIALGLLSGFNLLGQQKKWEVPANASNLTNPIKSNLEVLKEAKTIYISNCVPCHGKTGKGDGIAAAGLNPKPADHTSVALKSETDGALFWKLTEGRNAMPSYKNSLTEKQRWELVDFIRSLAIKN